MKGKILTVSSLILFLAISGCLNNNNRSDKENQSPIIDLSNTVDFGFVDANHDFTVTAFDPDGKVTLFEWDFDGDGSYDWNSTTTGNTSHRYHTTGIFNATLRVTDDEGETSIISKEIEISISNPPSPDIGFDEFQDGDIVSDIILLKGYSGPTSIDEYLINMSIIIDNIPHNCTYTEVTNDGGYHHYEWSFELDTRAYPNDELEITINAIYQDWGEVSSSITVIVIN